MPKRKTGDLQAEGRQRFYAFLNACGSDRAEAAKMLSTDPTLLDVRDGVGETVLHWFAIETVLPAVQWLLERGAEVNPRSHSNSTPLIDAAWLGHVEMCRLLLDNGADPTVQNQIGQNAFLVAASLAGKSKSSHEKARDLVTLLLEHLGKEDDINRYFDKWEAEEVLAREDTVATLLLAHGLTRPSWPEYDEDGS